MLYGTLRSITLFNRPHNMVFWVTVEATKHDAYLAYYSTFRWKRYVVPKRRTVSQLYGDTYQKIVLLIIYVL
jgi:hypothetical protein